MEDGYCCNCAEVIWNPLRFEKILAQIGNYIRKTYSRDVFRSWSLQINEIISRKHEKFGVLSLCPYCTVDLAKKILEKETKKKDPVLDKFLASFENI